MTAVYSGPSGVYGTTLEEQALRLHWLGACHQVAARQLPPGAWAHSCLEVGEPVQTCHHDAFSTLDVMNLEAQSASSTIHQASKQVQYCSVKE